MYVPQNRESTFIYTYTTSCAVSRTAERNSNRSGKFPDPPPPVAEGDSSGIVCTKIEACTCACAYTCALRNTCACIRAHIQRVDVAGSCRRQGNLREVVIWSNRFRFLCRFLFSIRHPAALPATLGLLSLVRVARYVSFSSKRIHRYSSRLPYSSSSSFSDFRDNKRRKLAAESYYPRGLMLDALLSFFFLFFLYGK